MSAQPTTIRGVLLDSGGTLVGPRGGRWNPRFDFEEVLLRHVPDAPVERFADAFAAGDRFLDAAPSTAGRDAYHCAVLAELGVTPTDALLAELNAPIDPDLVFDVYPEVRATVAALHGAELRLAVVTDNWGTGAGVVERMRALGLVGIELAVVSEELGCRKPDPRMYRTASDGLGLEPQECLFVDDDVDLVRAAVDLGYHGVAIRRGDASTPGDVAWVRTFDEVLDLVGVARHV